MAVAKAVGLQMAIRNPSVKKHSKHQAEKAKNEQEEEKKKEVAQVKSRHLYNESRGGRTSTERSKLHSIIECSDEEESTDSEEDIAASNAKMAEIYNTERHKSQRWNRSISFEIGQIRSSSFSEGTVKKCHISRSVSDESEYHRSSSFSEGQKRWRRSKDGSHSHTSHSLKPKKSKHYMIKYENGRKVLKSISPLTEEENNKIDKACKRKCTCNQNCINDKTKADKNNNMKQKIKSRFTVKKGNNGYIDRILRQLWCASDYNHTE